KVLKKVYRTLIPKYHKFMGNLLSTAVVTYACHYLCHPQPPRRLSKSAPSNPPTPSVNLPQHKHTELIASVGGGRGRPARMEASELGNGQDACCTNEESD